MTTEITLEKFADTVKRMRDSQKNYFRFHSKKELAKSIQLERMIDEMIKSILENKPIVEQQKLFL